MSRPYMSAIHSNFANGGRLHNYLFINQYVSYTLGELDEIPLFGACNHYVASEKGNLVYRCLHLANVANVMVCNWPTVRRRFRRFSISLNKF